MYVYLLWKVFTPMREIDRDGKELVAVFRDNEAAHVQLDRLTNRTKAGGMISYEVESVQCSTIHSEL